MFNKNVFKEQFRVWTEEHPDASQAEAKKFCEDLIPIEYKETYLWLEEQSLAWFAWKKEIRIQTYIAQDQDPLDKNQQDLH